MVERPIAEVELRPGDIVVSCHACGPLTDEVLDAVIQAQSAVAVLPCCQAIQRKASCCGRCAATTRT